MEVESPVPEVHSEPKLETVQGSASATKKRKRESSHSEPTAPSKQVKINDNDDENVKKDKGILYSSIDYRTKVWTCLSREKEKLINKNVLAIVEHAGFRLQ